jgi:hypothetical protein
MFDQCEDMVAAAADGVFSALIIPAAAAKLPEPEER